MPTHIVRVPFTADDDPTNPVNLKEAATTAAQRLQDEFITREP
jgi:hypothetical protein